jgi:DNA-3-methyladenine glycosylase I
MAKKLKESCSWPTKSPLMIEYHDKEWGVPMHDDRKLFELLILEGVQAGLNWETVLKKRENYRKALHDFDPGKIARYGKEDVKRLLSNSGIIRNHLKIEAAIINANKFLEIQNQFGSFDQYIWQFVGGNPIKNKFRSLSELPAKTRESDAMSKDLKRRGFKFAGPTICYAFMQAVGMVNDHMVNCFRYKELQGLIK